MGESMCGVPDVTCVIPTYNRALFLPSAIDSALSQEGVDVEVLVVDDGSTDATPRVLARYGDRIRVHRQANRERGAARNAGVVLAKAEYIVFLDSDDYFVPGYLQRALRVMDAAEAPAVFGRARYVDDSGRLVAHLPSRPLLRVTAEDLELGNVIPLSGVLVRKKAFLEVGGFREDRNIAVGGEDWELWVRLALAGDLPAVDGVAVECRAHDDNSAKNLTPHERALREVLSHILRQTQPTAGRARRARASLAVNLAVTQRNAGNVRAAVRRLAEAGYHHAPTLVGRAGRSALLHLLFGPSAIRHFRRLRDALAPGLAIRKSRAG